MTQFRGTGCVNSTIYYIKGRRVFKSSVERAIVCINLSKTILDHVSVLMIHVIFKRAYCRERYLGTTAITSGLSALHGAREMDVNLPGLQSSSSFN